MLEQLREWIVRYFPPVTFLGCYFLTVVLGNLLYTQRWARDYLHEYNISDRFFAFPETFTTGYWLLLFLPFLLTPPIVMLTRRYARRPLSALVAHARDLTYTQFVCLAGLVTAVLVIGLVQQDALSMLIAGDSFESTVEHRFELLDQLGFFRLTLLQSVLPYLAFYASIEALRTRTTPWRIAALALILTVATLTIILNMKWPVLLFFLGIVLCIFTYTRDHPYRKTLIGFVLIVVGYLVISSIILRLDLQLENSKYAGATQLDLSKSKASTGEAKKIPLAYVTKNLMNLLFFPVNRMAAGYPYYYHVFTANGPVCGGVLEQASRTPKCRPSTYIYSEIFGQDGFEGRGTSPQGVHISGYALGGWPIALLALTIASIILGLLSALSQHASASVSALFISGVLAGYHFSQIPGEGVIFYTHGLAWTAALTLLIALVNRRKNHKS